MGIYGEVATVPSPTATGTPTTRRARSLGTDSLRTGLFLRHGRRFAALLSIVLALDAADRSAIGVLAPNIKHAFHVSNTDIGFLAAAFGVVGGLATVPVGALTDRFPRVRLLAGSVMLWCVAMAIGGLAFSFAMLFAARLALGTVTATGGPTVMSITGDVYRHEERGRALSWIRAGEFAGAGLGFLIAGAVTALLSWRGVFLLFAGVGCLITFRVARLPEPARQSDHASELGVRAIWQAVRYVLAVPTNRTVILASGVGDFFFAAISVFGVLFAVRQYHVSQGTAAMLLPLVGVGAFLGLVFAGRATDALMARGVTTARVLVPAVCLLAAAVTLVPVGFMSSIAFGVPLLFFGGLLLAGPNPPLDAARL